MKKVKQGLAVLMAMAMLCGFMAFGVSAADAEPAQLTQAQMGELMGYARTVLSIAVLELALQRVPGWLNWAVFAKGSSYAAMEAELQAELAKTGIDVGEFFEMVLVGDVLEYGEEILTYNKVLAEKGPAIVKKHCAFYVGWALDCLIWANGLAGGLPVFA